MELSAKYPRLFEPDWLWTPGTSQGFEPEAGAWDADEAKDYAAETITLQAEHGHNAARRA
jgi:hypothetical protein